VKMEKIRQLFSSVELRKRLFFTLVMLMIHRLGMHISVPGVNAEALAQKVGVEYLFNAMDMVSGGALKSFSIFALGIAPYITASIVLQLIGVVLPAVEFLQKKDGEAGRSKINQWTRYLAVSLAFAQGFGVASLAQNLGSDLVIIRGLSFQLLCAVTLTAGSIFVMWIGEQITDRGIGNGISLLIFAGIVARLPKDIGTMGLMVRDSLVNKGNAAPPGVFLLLLFAMAIVLLVVVFVENSYRRIPIHYARRADSFSVASQHSSYLPLRVNTAGVMPVIFAGAVINFPAIVAEFTKIQWLQTVSDYIRPNVHIWIYTPVFVGVVVFFSFFYTSIVFNPDETADNMKKSGGYIPGIRPGKETSIYMDRVLSRLTFVGAIYLTIVSIVPLLMSSSIPGINFYYGGTSLLIVVGVALDTVAQLEGYQVMRRYEGFLEKGRIRGGRPIKIGGRTQ
jgi:preprotein translocase subunit SecY